MKAQKSQNQDNETIEKQLWQTGIPKISSKKPSETRDKSFTDSPLYKDL
jgi:hypothetical protein